MKKLLLSLLCFGLFFIPTSVFAKEKVNVYLFYGEGCPHCAELEKFLDSLPEEEQDKFDLYKYEVWYDDDNSSIMKTISDIRNDDATGVPYLIIGDESWVGYSSSFDEDILERIDKVYLQDLDERYDIADVYRDYLNGNAPSVSDDPSPYGSDNPYSYDDDDYDYGDVYSRDNDNWLESLSRMSIARLIPILIICLVVLGGIIGGIILIVVLATKKK